MKLLVNTNCLNSNVPDPFAVAGLSLHSSPTTCRDSQCSSELTKLFCKVVCVASTSAGMEDTTRSDSSQQPLLQKRLNAATGTLGTQGGLLIYSPAQGKASWPPGIGQSAST